MPGLPSRFHGYSQTSGSCLSATSIYRYIMRSSLPSPNSIPRNAWQVQAQENCCLVTIRTVENQSTPPLLRSHWTENRLEFPISTRGLSSRKLIGLRSEHLSHIQSP